MEKTKSQNPWSLFDDESMPSQCYAPQTNWCTFFNAIDYVDETAKIIRCSTPGNSSFQSPPSIDALLIAAALVQVNTTLGVIGDYLRQQNK